MADGGVLRVEVVSADGRIWEGDALSVITRTTEGDVGILPRHEPFLAALQPCATEILTTGGDREILAVDGGFVSVSDNRVSVLSQYATRAHSISLEEAQRELDKAEQRLDAGEIDEDTRLHYNRANAQVKAATRVAQTGR